MSNSFQILARFLEKFGDDVEGRMLEDAPAEVKTKLQAFSLGTLPRAEQPELIKLLHANPQWVGLLAQEAKARRPHRPTND